MKLSVLVTVAAFGLVAIVEGYSLTPRVVKASPMLSSRKMATVHRSRALFGRAKNTLMSFASLSTADSSEDRENQFKQRAQVALEKVINFFRYTLYGFLVRIIVDVRNTLDKALRATPLSRDESVKDDFMKVVETMQQLKEVDEAADHSETLISVSVSPKPEPTLNTVTTEISMPPRSVDNGVWASKKLEEIRERQEVSKVLASSSKSYSMKTEKEDIIPKSIPVQRTVENAVIDKAAGVFKSSETFEMVKSKSEAEDSLSEAATIATVVSTPEAAVVKDVLGISTPTIPRATGSQENKAVETVSEVTNSYWPVASVAAQGERQERDVKMTQEASIAAESSPLKSAIVVEEDKPVAIDEDFSKERINTVSSAPFGTAAEPIVYNEPAIVAVSSDVVASEVEVEMMATAEDRLDTDTRVESGSGAVDPHAYVGGAWGAIINAVGKFDLKKVDLKKSLEYELNAFKNAKIDLHLDQLRVSKDGLHMFRTEVIGMQKEIDSWFGINSFASRSKKGSTDVTALSTGGEGKSVNAITIVPEASQEYQFNFAESDFVSENGRGFDTTNSTSSSTTLK